MRAPWALLLAIIVVPLSGCHDIRDDAPAETVFAEWSLPAGSPAPFPVGDCQDLLTTLNDRALAEADTMLDASVEGKFYGRPMWRGGGDLVFLAQGAESADSAGSPPPTAPLAADAEVTGTNVQEQGVDEADVLKTDGEWTYVLQGQYLYILHSDRVGDIEEHARIRLDNNTYSGQLLLEPRDADDPDDDRLIVLTSTWRETEPQEPPQENGDSYYPYYYRITQQLARIQVYDLSDRRDPTLEEELWIEGYNVGARLVGGHLYVVVHSAQYDMPMRTYVEPYQTRPVGGGEYESTQLSKEALEQEAAEARAENRATARNLTLDDHLPVVLRPGADGEPREIPLGPRGCERFLITENSTGRSVSTILSMSVGDDMEQRLTQVLGSSPIVYASGDALVLAAASRDAWWFWGNADIDEATDLQWFDLEGLDVTHRASGRATGIVQDSFGIDVHGGKLRVATTTGQWGRWWVEDPVPMMNHLAVFDAQAERLVPTGIVGGIAPGERIWSARFTDERAYLVTFQQVDPLWVIDLTGAQPKILGELEIPGVSTYIHPISDDLLLTIGMGGTEDGLDWGRIQISLFDISDPSKPARADVLDLTPGGGWSGSSALHEHKAFTYWDSIGVLAIPVTKGYDHREDGQGKPRGPLVTLQLIDVDTGERSLSLQGEVDQDVLQPEQNDTYYYGQAEVERSYFLGVPGTSDVSVYAMSRFGMTAHDLDSLELQGWARFQMENAYQVYPVDVVD